MFSFRCSRKASAGAITRSYSWVIAAILAAGHGTRGDSDLDRGGVRRQPFGARERTPAGADPRSPPRVTRCTVDDADEIGGAQAAAGARGAAVGSTWFEPVA